jgi:hypothetical protein
VSSQTVAIIGMSRAALGWHLFLLHGVVAAVPHELCSQWLVLRRSQPLFSSSREI